VAGHERDASVSRAGGRPPLEGEGVWVGAGAGLLAGGRGRMAAVGAGRWPALPALVCAGRRALMFVTLTLVVPERGEPLLDLLD
jgi:hypothetical protein